MTFLSIRPAAVLTAAVGVSGVLLGLAMANLLGAYRPGPAAAPGWVAPAPPDGWPAATESSGAAGHRPGAPAARGTSAAAGSKLRGATATVTPAGAEAPASVPPSPPGPATTTPPAVTFGAVEGEPCTVEGRTALTDSNDELTCVDTDGRLRWLSPASLHSVPPG